MKCEMGMDEEFLIEGMENKKTLKKVHGPSLVLFCMTVEKEQSEISSIRFPMSFIII